MAYQRPSNPDELPRFAEPEHRGGSRPAPSQYQSRPNPPPSNSRPQNYQSGGRDHLGPSSRHDSYSNSPMSPPPQTTGPRPSAHNRPPPATRPPPSPAPEGADPSLLPLFRAVDKDGTGQLSERELSAALVNGDWTAFDPHTVRMMIRMFDSDRSGTIGFDEFCGLWSFLASWRTLFDRFDTDRSGNISLDEFTNALVAFRYRLSPGFVKLLFDTYDKRGEGVMSFDLFVQACISLKRMTDVFKKYDDDRDGYITLSFEDFLVEILKQLK
ncbi:EF-hand [Xylariaceae sp. FL0255]|nr:EF-hand [Xylariaceae sp. FL0255]